jgi:hypothetical protein
MNKEEFVVASEDRSVRSLHSSGSVLGRPVVTLEEMVGNPLETLQNVEVSARNLFVRAYQNVTTEATNVTRRLAIIAFEAVNVKNVYSKIVSNVMGEKNRRIEELKFYPGNDDNSQNTRQLLVDRLVELNNGSEELLGEIEEYNQIIKHINMTNTFLRKSVDKMGVTFSKVIPELLVDDDIVNSPDFAESDGNVYIAERNIVIADWEKLFSTDKKLEEDQRDPVSQATGILLVLEV